MKVVYKYTLNYGVTSIELPIGSILLHVAEQYGQLVLYVEQETDNEIIKPTTIHVIGTGHTFPNLILEYINSVMADNGLVWYIYIRKYNDGN